MMMGSNNDAERPPRVKIEGCLYVRLGKRRRRYCVLAGRTLSIFASKEEAVDKAPARKTCCVVGVKDMGELQRGTKETLVGPGLFHNAIIVSTLKSKLLVVEADTKTEKDRWLHAMMSLNFCSEDAERGLVRESLNQPDFDAQLAVTLLYKFRDNSDATDMVVDHLTQYAHNNIDDVEFYLPQIVHLLVHADTNMDKLIGLLLSICKAKSYVAHLGNSIHLALHLFWLLEAIIHDCRGTPTYNLVAKLLMSIEAQVVNQHCDLKDLIVLFRDVPGLKDTIVAKKDSETREAAPTDNAATNGISLSESEKHTLLQWMEQERMKRYKYFHQVRDFIQALTAISETMRHMEPREARKVALPGILNKLVIPEMAYIPLGRASDPFCRVVRVLEHEGTVFSTHSRAPCLLCFEVVEEPSHPSPSSSSAWTQAPRLAATSEMSMFEDDAETLQCIQTNLALHFGSAAVDVDENTRDEDDNASTAHSIKDVVGQSIQTTIMRRTSRTAYDTGLAKLMLLETAVFGESWIAKKKRLQEASPFGHLKGWNVISLISKSNDDMRQEVFALQLIAKIQDIFRDARLPLWLRSYRIVSTGHSTGLIETITDAPSLDALKKRKDFTTLRNHFDKTYGASPIARTSALHNYVHSLAAYSLVCYILQVKDRHNGNILLDKQGHLVHIDFGFLLGIAPGGNWSLESQPPFKLTKEMVEVLGGPHSPLFAKFVQLFTLGFLALQRNADKIITMVEIMMHKSTFPCFQNRDVVKELAKLRDRFVETLPLDVTVKHAVKLVKLSYKNKWTKRYDQFQKITNGILP
ncbi:hypothetical protein AeNC1_005866 [Aphanomyces euteiches]|nr:hypothetical protein AeNC1_005866 [Aphanomyces euteiches]